MTNVTLSLPDTLAQEARAAGLLTPEAVEAMLRERLRSQRDALTSSLPHPTTVTLIYDDTNDEWSAISEAFRLAPC